MNNKILYSIVTVAFVGGLFSAAYATLTITLAGTVDMDNNQIKNLQDPTDPSDAVTKSFVEANQYVPYKTKLEPSSDCATAPSQGDVDQIIIDNNGMIGHFTITSVVLVSSGLDDPSDNFFVTELSIDSDEFDFDTGKLISHPSFNDGIDIMGVKVGGGEGRFPTQIIAENSGTDDVVIKITCQPFLTGNITIDKIIVSGWKLAGSTVSIDYFE